MRVDVYEKLCRRQGKSFLKEIIPNCAEGAKKILPPSWTQEKILALP